MEEVSNLMKGDPMHPLRGFTLYLLSLSIAGTTTALSQERDRSKVPDKYKWNLTDIYASDAAWKSAKEKLMSELPSIGDYRGKLASSPQTLLECFENVSRLSKEFARLYSYASLHHDLDTRDAATLAMQQEMQQVGADFGAKTAYIDPEILTMDKPKVESFIKAEPRLEKFRHGLDQILRRKEHTGTEGEEKIIADASLMADAPNSIFSIFSNAEFPFPEVKLSDGKTVKLDKAALSLYRATSNREDRKKVFSTYFGRMNDYRRTFGTQLYAEVKKDMFYMKAQKYQSCLASALDGSNIPLEVYHSLIDNVNKNLPTFHRYLNLRKKMIGVDQLHYYDMYAPMVGDVDLKYTIEESQKHILASLAPLGDDYVAVAKKAFNERWVDVYPNDGKTAGAYSNGAVYDVHPYMLLNYNGKYDDMSTLAHELGHTMHSFYSNKTQPYPTARYSIFVAEVASTFNEALLMDYLLKTIKDDRIRLSLLGNYLDGVKGTLFRQVQFAEFELGIHEMAEKGETLTGDVLNKLYEGINRKYYGHDQGVCTVDDEMKVEWANVPHFYLDFYVFQYATSLTASSALSEQVLAGDKGATARYRELIASGGSDYPINLLKKAGVDMTTPVPFELMIKKMNRVMDEMEKILAKTKK
jgi:oligoendopeptidase F